jgi:hypothetical protein
MSFRCKIGKEKYEFGGAKIDCPYFPVNYSLINENLYATVV